MTETLPAPTIATRDCSHVKRISLDTVDRLPYLAKKGKLEPDITLEECEALLELFTAKVNAQREKRDYTVFVREGANGQVSVDYGSLGEGKRTWMLGGSERAVFLHKLLFDHVDKSKLVKDDIKGRSMTFANKEALVDCLNKAVDFYGLSFAALVVVGEMRGGARATQAETSLR